MGRGHQDPRLPTGRDNADQKEATGLGSAGATSSLNGSSDSPVWAETRSRQQTVCRHLEFVWRFQVLKAKKKRNTFGAYSNTENYILNGIWGSLPNWGFGFRLAA